MSAENVQLVRTFLQAFAERGHRDPAVLDLLAEDVEVPELAGSPGSQRYEGRAGFVEVWDKWLESFDEISLEDEELIDPGERVVVISHAFTRGKRSRIELDMEIATVFGVRGGEVTVVQLCSARDEALRVAGLAQ